MSRRAVASIVLATVLLIAGTTAWAAEAPYPFEGSWVRADRTCSASSTRERVYTARDVTSGRGHCAIRRIATGSGSSYELFQRCDRPPANVSEVIRMTGPDSLVLTRQTTRLKISRSLHFARCPAVPTRSTR